MYIAFIDVPSVDSTSLLSSAYPSPSTSPTLMSPTNLWPVLFAPLAVVLLVLFIVAVAAILCYKRRRRKLNLKAVKGSPEDEKDIEQGKG